MGTFHWRVFAFWVLIPVLSSSSQTPINNLPSQMNQHPSNFSETGTVGTVVADSCNPLHRLRSKPLGTILYCRLLNQLYTAFTLSHKEHKTTDDAKHPLDGATSKSGRNRRSPSPSESSSAPNSQLTRTLPSTVHYHHPQPIIALSSTPHPHPQHHPTPLPIFEWRPPAQEERTRASKSHLSCVRRSKGC